MSWQAVQWAIYDSPMLLTDAGHPDITAHKVLIVLAESADEHGGNAHPSVLRLQYGTRADERTVQRALIRLEKAGLIKRTGYVHGCVRWRLAMGAKRPESDWEEFQARAEKVRETESQRRADRRARAAAADVSGTQDPGTAPAEPAASGTQSTGHIEPDVSTGNPVRDLTPRRPVLNAPASGTLSTGVRDATPPEPPRIHPGTTKGSTNGGTLPPNPLRPQAPTTSGLGTDERDTSTTNTSHPPQALDRHLRPHARETAGAATAAGAHGDTHRCENGHTAGNRTEPDITGCAHCATNAASARPRHLHLVRPA